MVLADEDDVDGVVVDDVMEYCDDDVYDVA